jgi:hypothetical protein
MAGTIYFIGIGSVLLLNRDSFDDVNCMLFKEAPFYNKNFHAEQVTNPATSIDFFLESRMLPRCLGSKNPNQG